TVSVATQKLAY
ncbi:bacterial extracellular solute-binding family protein, partial [Vibrio parahaemolyticus V-223/04]